jgi:hypothetical protein
MYFSSRSPNYQDFMSNAQFLFLVMSAQYGTWGELVADPGCALDCEAFSWFTY